MIGPNGASCKIKGEAATERLFKRRTKFSSCDIEGSCKWGGDAGVVWHDPFSHCTRVVVELVDPTGKLGDIQLDVDTILQRTSQLQKDPALSQESFQRFVELIANDDPKDDGGMSEEWGVWYPVPKTVVILFCLPRYVNRMLSICTILQSSVHALSGSWLVPFLGRF